MGMSMPFSRARRASTGAVNTPSATVLRSDSSSSAERPSPIPLPSEKLREPGEGLAAGAEGETKASHFREPAADQGSTRVLTEAFALDDAARDGEDVFHRTTDFRTGHIVGDIDAKRWQADPRA